MATKRTLAPLFSVIEDFKSIDIDLIRREGLGEESLSAQFDPLYEEVSRIVVIASTYAIDVHDNQVHEANHTVTRLVGSMNEQAGRESSEYIAHKDHFLSEIRDGIEESKAWMPAFAGTAIFQQGLLEDKDVRRETEQAVQEIRRHTSRMATDAENRIEAAVDAANKLVKDIENKARMTATGVSVKAAQDQFQRASDHDRQQANRWFWGSIGVIGLLLIVAVGFMLWPLPETDSETTQWTSSLYYALLRILILSTIASVAAFTLRVYRAFLHLSERNKHRVRVANSVESFVQSALEPNQRDLILGKLTDAVVNFGDSGLVQQKGDDGSTVSGGDVVGRIIAAMSDKRG